MGLKTEKTEVMTEFCSCMRASVVRLRGTAPWYGIAFAWCGQHIKHRTKHIHATRGTASRNKRNPHVPAHSAAHTYAYIRVAYRTHNHSSARSVYTAVTR